MPRKRTKSLKEINEQQSRIEDYYREKGDKEDRKWTRARNAAMRGKDVAKNKERMQDAAKNVEQANKRRKLASSIAHQYRQNIANTPQYENDEIAEGKAFQKRNDAQERLRQSNTKMFKESRENNINSEQTKEYKNYTKLETKYENARQKEIQSRTTRLGRQYDSSVYRGQSAASNASTAAQSSVGG